MRSKLLISFSFVTQENYVIYTQLEVCYLYHRPDEIVHCATVCNVKFDSNSSCDDIWVIL